MGKHLLSLGFPPSANQGILQIDDTSVYDSLLPVSCPDLQITPPGYTTPTLLRVSSGFRLALNACGVGMLSPGRCAEGCPNLPDGIWDIRYSIAPNDRVYAVYKVMRITGALNTYHEMLCRLNLKCCLPDQEVQEQVRELDFIYNMLISAKTNVEDCGRLEDGDSMYKYAISLMNKMSYCKPYC